jgi:hypothetical protein
MSNGNSASDQDSTGAQRKSGRAVFGEDGRSSWEWQTSTGVFTRDITDQQLDALQAPQLELVDPCEAVTVRRPRPALKSAAQAREAPRGGKLRRLLRRVAQMMP